MAEKISDVIDIETKGRYVPDNLGVKDEAERLCRKLEAYYHAAGFPQVKAWVERRPRVDKKTGILIGYHYDVRSNLSFDASALPRSVPKRKS